MTAAEERVQWSSIPLPHKAKEELISIKQGNETYWDILKPFIQSAKEVRAGVGTGVVFLNNVYVNGELRNLKSPMPLTLRVDELDGLVLSNDVYGIIVTCSNLNEGFEEAREVFDEIYQIYVNTSQKQTEKAKKFALFMQKSV